MALIRQRLTWCKMFKHVLCGGLFWLMMAHAAAGAEISSSATNLSSAFNIDAATQAYLDRIPTAQRTRSDAYFEGGYWLQLWQYLWGAGIALLLLQSRLSARMRDVAVRWTRFRPLQTALYALAYIFLTAALAFPLTLYSDFYREHQYGLATQSFAAWLGDQLKGLLLSLIFGCLLIVVLVGIVRRLKTSWHIWGSAFVLAFVAFAALISPVFIAPLFNKYTLLADPKVLNPILSLARANGIATDKVYEMDASRQTTRVSANVSGLLGTMRITLNDNLVNRCSLPEIEAVMAHEMGHYVLNHVYKLLLFLGVVITIGFGVLRYGLGWLIARFGERWGISDVGDVAVLPLAALLFSTYIFLMTPVLNTFIRSQETEADIFGLNAARQPDGMAQAALKLADYRKMAPSPLEEWFFFDHPSGATRIRNAMRWKAENLQSCNAGQ